MDELTNWHDIDKEPFPCTIGGCMYLVCGVERLPNNIKVKHFAVLKTGAHGHLLKTGNWSKYIITHWAVVTAPWERIDDNV